MVLITRALIVVKADKQCQMIRQFGCPLIVAKIFNFSFLQLVKYHMQHTVSG